MRDVRRIGSEIEGVGETEGSNISGPSAYRTGRETEGETLYTGPHELHTAELDRVDDQDEKDLLHSGG